ncbi:MAG: GNAT family N-acetyltransferase [Jatrophihabitantaceae bacterium]
MSEPEIVNPIPVDDVPDWLANLSTAFLQDASSESHRHYVAARRRNWIPDRAWGAQDRGRWIATLATQPRVLTVPGRDGTTTDLDVDALTNVTVNATHRRRGLLTTMLGRSLEAARDRGEPLSMLVAAEWPIYGRFGYSCAVQGANYTYFMRPPNAKIERATGGSVRQVSAEQFGAIAPTVYERARRLRAGQVDRHDPWWNRRLGLDGYGANYAGPHPYRYVHEAADGPDGLLSWAPCRDFDLDGSLGAIKVEDLVAVTDEAYRNLWAYLGGLDVVSEVVLRDRPTDEPARWLMPDGRALRQDYTGDWLWLRLLDIPASLMARSYAVPGQLVLQVADEDIGGYGAGRFALDAAADGTSCRPTTGAADLQVSQRTLASVYLGARTFAQARLAEGVDELTSGALARADAMFATGLAPWNATGF